MKILTVNIVPWFRIDKSVREKFFKLFMQKGIIDGETKYWEKGDKGGEERADRILSLIDCQKPDIVFFIEQGWPPYTRVIEKMELPESEYEIVIPDNYMHNGNGTYSGVTAAIKKEYKERCPEMKDGPMKEEDVRRVVPAKKTAQFLRLTIDGQIFLGVHYPPFGKDRDGINYYPDFHEGIQAYVAKEKPLMVIGDFNPLPGAEYEIDGYEDVLPKKYDKDGEQIGTYANDNKLDYIFVSEKFLSEGGCKPTAKQIDETRTHDDDLFFSDHSATMVTLDLPSKQ